MINLDKLPDPEVLETLEYEAILSDLKASFQSRGGGMVLNGMWTVWKRIRQ